jgi:hypothetical protein
VKLWAGSSLLKMLTTGSTISRLFKKLSMKPSITRVASRPSFYRPNIGQGFMENENVGHSENPDTGIDTVWYTEDFSVNVFYEDGIWN